MLGVKFYMKKKIKIILCILIPILIFLIIILSFYFTKFQNKILNAIDSLISEKEYFNKYPDKKYSVYVVTKNKKEKLNYYEITVDNKKEIKKFKYDDNKIIYLQDCFQSYISYESDRSKILNKINDECKTIDDNDIEIDKDEEINDIINNISKINHDIWGSPKIINVNGNYFVEVALNVNLWSPYDLYKYENGKLYHLYTFNGESIVAIKEK